MVAIQRGFSKDGAIHVGDVEGDQVTAM